MGRTQSGILRHRILFSVSMAIWISIFFLWNHFTLNVGTGEKVLIGIGAIELVIVAAVAISHYASLLDFAADNYKTFFVLIVPAMLVYAVGLWHLIQSTGKTTYLTQVMPILLIFSGVSLLLYFANIRLREEGGLSAYLWGNLKTDQRTAEVALCVMILLLSGGIAVVASGYENLGQDPYLYYPSPSSADPVRTEYTVSENNITVEVNVSHTTNKEEFVVGEYIASSVTLTRKPQNESVEEPRLFSIAFPTDDEWNFGSFLYWSQDTGSHLFVSGSRFYPEPGDHNTTQQWIVQDESGSNCSIPIHLNLTVYGRQVIEPFERERERWFDTYLQMYMAQRQEAFNLIAIGFSLIFVAALIPEMARLVGQLAKGKNRVGAPEKGGQR